MASMMAFPAFQYIFIFLHFLKTNLADIHCIFYYPYPSYLLLNDVYTVEETSHPYIFYILDPFSLLPSASLSKTLQFL